MSALDRKQEKKAGGIDVSAHNGAVDWKKVKASGVDFAVIRAGYGNTISQKDERFDENMKNALEAGLGVGIYWFSYAINPEDARKEAAVCKEVLQKWKGKFAYPVFYDFEYATETYAKEQGVTFSNSGRTDVILAFLEEMKRDYTAGYYSNPDYLTYKLEYSRLKGWPLWLAQYKAEPEWQCVLQQSSSTGRISGISGNVDTDVAYTEYALPKPEKPETGEKPETAKQYTIRAGDTLWDIAQKEKTLSLIHIFSCGFAVPPGCPPYQIFLLRVCFPNPQGFTSLLSFPHAIPAMRSFPSLLVYTKKERE